MPLQLAGSAGEGGWGVEGQEGGLIDTVLQLSKNKKMEQEGRFEEKRQ